VNPIAALALLDEALARLERRFAGPGDPGRQVDGDDVPAIGQQGLVNGREVAHGRLRGRGALVALSQTLEEARVIVSGDLDLGAGLALKRDIEADALDVMPRDELLREIGRRVGDDGGVRVRRHRAVLSRPRRPAGLGPAGAASTIPAWARLW
jgi:hypothetical protein